AIRIFTKGPADEYGVRARATIGSFNRRDVDVNADLPISDTLKTKVTVASEQRDGYVTSLETGRKTGELDDQILRFDMRWDPSDRFDLRFTAEDASHRSTQPNYTLHIF